MNIDKSNPQNGVRGRGLPGNSHALPLANPRVETYLAGGYNFPTPVGERLSSCLATAQPMRGSHNQPMKSHYTPNFQITPVDFLLPNGPLSCIKEPSPPLFGALAYGFAIACSSCVAILCRSPLKLTFTSEVAGKFIFEVNIAWGLEVGSGPSRTPRLARRQVRMPTGPTGLTAFSPPWCLRVSVLLDLSPHALQALFGMCFEALGCLSLGYSFGLQSDSFLEPDHSCQNCWPLSD